MAWPVYAFSTYFYYLALSWSHKSLSNCARSAVAHYIRRLRPAVGTLIPSIFLTNKLFTPFKAYISNKTLHVKNVIVKTTKNILDWSWRRANKLKMFGSPDRADRGLTRGLLQTQFSSFKLLLMTDAISCRVSYTFSLPCAGPPEKKGTRKKNI